MRIAEEETAYLVLEGKGRALDLRFGPGWASLSDTCEWAIDAIRERRRVQESEGDRAARESGP